MSAYGRCPPMGGVRQREVSVSGGLTVVEQNVPFTESKVITTSYDSRIDCLSYFTKMAGILSFKFISPRNGAK